MPLLVGDGLDRLGELVLDDDQPANVEQTFAELLVWHEPHDRVKNVGVLGRREVAGRPVDAHGDPFHLLLLIPKSSFGEHKRQKSLFGEQTFARVCL